MTRRVGAGLTRVLAAACPRMLALACAAVFGAAIGYSVARIPIQVSDSLVEILEAQRSPSIAASFSGNFEGGAPYFRPLRIAQIKALFDAAGGHYQLVYRGFHVLLVLALLWLFTRALHVTSHADLAIAVFAMTVLTGLHTFLGLVREAFPINHFLEIAVLCLAALNLSQSRGGWLVDGAAIMLFAVAALTLESGLLVWVVVAAAWTTGMRGVSGRGLAVMTALLVGYVALRSEFLSSPGSVLTERSSGFLLERLEPGELEARFGAQRLLYHVYNVGAALLSVLLAEPRDGVFVAVRAWRDGDVLPRVHVALVSSAATTAMIVWWARDRWRQRGPLAPLDRVAIVAAVVCVANAALSFGYTKDEIVSVAGVFYALAAYVAGRALVERMSASPRTVAVCLLSAALLVVGSAWAVRSVGVHHVLRLQAFRVRNDWARVPRHLQESGMPLPRDSAAIVDQLQQEALDARVPNSELLPEWNTRWFGD